MSIPIKSPVNFRDLGGIRNAEGAMVKKKRLLRSGEVTNLSPEEHNALARDYDLAVLVDFRTEGEAQYAPDEVFDNVVYHNLDIFAGDEEQASNMENFRKVDTVPLATQFMYQVYSSIVENKGAQRHYARFLRMIRDNTSGAVLFHCYAGKDRTGYAAALIYTLLGVSKDAIFEDYLKTNEMRAEWNVEMLENARRQGLDKEAIEALRTLFVAQEDFLHKSFSLAEAHSGTMLNYIQQALEVTNADIDSIRQNYLL